MLSTSDFEGLIGPFILTEFEGRTLNPMSVQELKEALGPEATNLTITYAANGNQILHVGDKNIEVGPMASNDEIKAALHNPTVPTLNTRVTVSAIDRIKAKALRARNIAPDAIRAFEADLDGLIAQETEIETMRHAAVFPHQEAIAGVKGAIDGVKSAIDILSNGEPV